MADVNRNRTYIDTGVTGLVIQIPHNMGEFVYPWLWELNGSGHKVHVPLFDSRIAELKNLDNENFQVSFNSPFEGYVDLLSYNIPIVSQMDKLLKLEKELNEIKDLLPKYTTSSQWKQMNTYIESRLSSAESNIENLKTEFKSLSDDVAEL